MTDPSRQNNFDLVRLVAAMSVVFFHSTKHLQIDMGLLGDVGSYFYLHFPGVPVFFVVSGYLVSASLFRSSSLGSYAIKRALRILPALWAVTIASVLLVGGFGFLTVDVLTGPRFFGWLAGQLTFLQLYNPPFLRGFGVGALNGSLWTIPVEIGFYVLLPILFACFGRLRLSDRVRDGLLLAIAAASFATYVWVRGHPDNATVMALKLLKASTLPHLYMFTFGVLLQLHGGFVDRFVAGRAVHWVALYLGMAELAAFVGVETFAPVVFGLKAVLACAVIACAYTAKPLSDRILRGNDISYGVYLVHMPIVNTLVHLGHQGERLWLGVAVGASLLLATLSWVWIEQPALRLKAATLLRKGAG